MAVAIIQQASAYLNKQWDDIIELMKDQHLVPMVDIAYQGFGDGLDEDAYGVRCIASSLPTLPLLFKTLAFTESAPTRM